MSYSNPIPLKICRFISRFCQQEHKSIKVSVSKKKKPQTFFWTLLQLCFQTFVYKILSCSHLLWVQMHRGKKDAIESTLSFRNEHFHRLCKKIITRESLTSKLYWSLDASMALSRFFFPTKHQGHTVSELISISMSFFEKFLLADSAILFFANKFHSKLRNQIWYFQEYIKLINWTIKNTDIDLSFGWTFSG